VHIILAVQGRIDWSIGGWVEERRKGTELMEVAGLGWLRLDCLVGVNWPYCPSWHVSLLLFLSHIFQRLIGRMKDHLHTLWLLFFLRIGLYLNVVVKVIYLAILHNIPLELRKGFDRRIWFFLLVRSYWESNLIEDLSKYVFGIIGLIDRHQFFLNSLVISSLLTKHNLVGRIQLFICYLKGVFNFKVSQLRPLRLLYWQ
jgi:hypothetical protein